MKLSSRERIMLLVLAIIAIFAASYFLLIQPQLKKIAVLAVENLEFRNQKVDIEKELASGSMLDTDIAKLTQEIDEAIKPFYPAILQDKIIITLDEIIKRTSNKSNSNNFTQVTIATVAIEENNSAVVTYPLKELAKELYPPEPDHGEKVEDENTQTDTTDQENNAGNNSANQQTENQVECMSVTLTLDGSFVQTMNFIKALEALNRTILVRNLVITGNEPEQTLMSNLQMEFYALPKVNDQDKEYFNWPYNNTYGKGNPFVK